MIEELLPHLYRIEIPLPGSPLMALNSYLIKGPSRSLLIDTGMNREECLSAANTSLKQLGVDREKMDFFITHLHADHLGLAGTLAAKTSKVFFNEVEAEVINASPERTEQHQQSVFTFFLANGFPEAELKEAMAAHPARRYGGSKNMDFSIVGEGDTIEIGDYSFRCLTTPGHSPGHLCLYETKQKVLVAGDHILLEITPNITLWPEMGDSLKAYLASLEKVYTLDVALVLPGHGSIMKNLQQRIRALQEHHKNRLSEALSALKASPRTAYEVAPYLTWDIPHDPWEDFPAPQKWFAVGETMAHLRYLEGQGRVRAERRGGRVVYSPV